MATGFGALLVGTTHGGRARIREYYVAAGYATAMYKGDFVTLVPTTGEMNVAVDGIAANTKLGIQQAATGNKLLGFIVGFEPSPTALLSDNYRAASTARRVMVCDDPEAVFAIQEDAVGGAVTAALVGSMSNADIIVAAGNTRNGLSGTMLDSNTAAATGEDIKILGVLETPDNVAAQSGGAILLCKILDANHALRSTDSQS